MEDDALIARLAEGDDMALRVLFSRHAPWLAARLRSVLPAADVEDVLQETFIAVWRGARTYRPQRAAGAWMWGIARRQAAMLLRRGGSAVLGEALEDRVDALAGDLAESTQVRMDLEAAVAALGPPGGPEREVWQLLYVEDRSVDEVASITGVQPGTVKSRSFRARRLLRAALRAGEARKEGPS